jgi:hypothetical protein
MEQEIIIYPPKQTAASHGAVNTIYQWTTQPELDLFRPAFQSLRSADQNQVQVDLIGHLCHAAHRSLLLEARSHGPWYW